jgi:hypothetical protein
MIGLKDTIRFRDEVQIEVRDKDGNIIQRVKAE